MANARVTSGTRRSRTRWLAATLIGFAPVACRLGDLITPASAVVVLTVAPADTVLNAPGDTFCLRWEAKDIRGRTVGGVAPVFALVAPEPAIVTVDARTGCVAAVARGGEAASIRATADTVTVEVVARVRQEVVNLVIQPVDTTLQAVGDRLCYRWSATDGEGVPVSGVIPSFAILDNGPGILTNDSIPGCFIAAKRAQSAATVQATIDRAAATATVRVPVGK